MRRYLAVFLTLVLLSVAGMTAAAISVNAARDQLTVTETVHYGDPAVTEGLRLGYRAQHAYQLYWDIDFRAGQNPTVAADYTFYPTEHRIHERSDPGYMVSLSNDIFLYSDSIGTNQEATGLTRVLSEMYEACPPGEELRRVVNIGDYYDFYPISGYIRLPGILCEWDDQTLLWGNTHTDLPLSAFGDFFRIPIVEGHSYELHLSRSSGHGMSYGGGTSDTGDFYRMTTYNALTENAMILAINNRTGKGTRIDTSHIPGGYGLYRLPLTVENGSSTPQIEALSMCYPLDEEVQVEKLRTSADGRHLLLFTREAEGHVLTVIDCDSMQTLQRLPYYAGQEDFYATFEEEGYFVLLFGREWIVVLTENADGTYHTALSAPASSPEGEHRLYFRSTAVTAWDGEKLVIADFTADRYTTPNFRLSVFAKQGLIYYGDYILSLSTGYSVDDYDYYCIADSEINLQWEKS